MPKLATVILLALLGGWGCAVGFAKEAAQQQCNPQPPGCRRDEHNGDDIICPPGPLTMAQREWIRQCCPQRRMTLPSNGVFKLGAGICDRGDEPPSGGTPVPEYPYPSFPGGTGTNPPLQGGAGSGPPPGNRQLITFYVPVSDDARAQGYYEEVQPVQLNVLTSFLNQWSPVKPEDRNRTRQPGTAGARNDTFISAQVYMTRSQIQGTTTYHLRVQNLRYYVVHQGRRVALTYRGEASATYPQ
jgi:hypothetical protein